ncbi:MAG TPA: hypothetical protein VG013_05655 [Gemmataceae bacterium]|nr:hypothetical protein [Gemmataceae bacterium]
MKMLRIAAGSSLGLALVVGSVLAAGSLKSGPQVGDEVPGPFHPLNVTGPDAGEKVCLYCKNGAHPVAMVFARECNPTVARLIKQIDKATAKHSDAKMGSFVVFLNDDEKMPKKIKKLADKEAIENTVLAVQDSAGPDGYDVAKDADVTVVLYTKHMVKANYAFKKGELKDKDIERILNDVPKILPQQ